MYSVFALFQIHTQSEACGSNIGYRRLRSDPLAVTYSAYCLRMPGAIQHELLHVLGLLHEQSRPDRDDFVQIVWSNIEPEFVQNFMKADDATAETFGLPYDFDSLMHYPSNAFARPHRNITIYAKVTDAVLHKYLHSHIFTRSNTYIEITDRSRTITGSEQWTHFLRSGKNPSYVLLNRRCTVKSSKFGNLLCA